MRIIKGIYKRKALLAFLLSSLLGMLIVLPNVILNKGIFAIISDFNFQQVPFNMLMNKAIKNGNILWTWYNELGSNFIGTFSFYNLLSPFSIFGYLFPGNWYPYLVGPIIILKYGVGGLTSYLFLKRYVKNKNYAIVGSLLYSFSGFQLTNMLFHFQDIIALFPLMLYALDNLIYDGKKGHFTLAIVLNAFTNWFLFIAEGVFLIIYFLIKVVTKEYKITTKSFFTIILEGILGLGISAIILIPSAFFTISNPRINNSWTISRIFKYDNFGKYLEILRAFILPSETMVNRAIISSENYGSVDLYLPVVGIVLVISYILKNPKNWLTVLMITCIIFMGIPFLNSSFVLLRDNYYARWFFMPSLIMSLLSIKCLENKYKITPGILFSILLMILFAISCIFMANYWKTNPFIFNKHYLFFMISFAILNLLVMYIIGRLKQKKKIILLVSVIFVFVGFWGNYTIYIYKGNSLKTYEGYYTYLNESEIFKSTSDDMLRTNSTTSCSPNISYINNIMNIKNFNTNINGSNFSFYDSIEYYRTVSTEISPKYKDLNSLLGIQYIISCDTDVLEEEQYQLIKSNNDYKIYYNSDYKELGFAPKEYISKDEFSKVAMENKPTILLTKIVLDSKQINKYKDLYEVEANYLSNVFKYKRNGFESIIETTEPTIAVYAIPYDNGWYATNNGQKIEIENVNNGLIGIKLNKGKNKIEFNYCPEGLILGSFISIISLLSFIIYSTKKHSDYL